ncbi:spermidine synthase [Patescibacteria group bacterium]
MSVTDLLSGFRIIDRKQSKYSGELTVVKDVAWGTYIKAGGLPQSGGLARKIWKKPLERVKNYDLRVEKILILGFGGGGMVGLIKKHWPDSRITGVDIDPAIVELGRKYIKWDSNNVEVAIEDGEKFVNNITTQQHPLPNTNKYDLVLVDTYYGATFPEKFKKAGFTRRVKKVLNKNGVAVFNRLYGSEDRVRADKFGRMLEKNFKSVESLQPVANIMFICTK